MPNPQHANATGTELHVDLRIKEPCRVASTANVTLTAPGASIDGVTLTSGDRMLLKNQTTASQNGIYVFNGSASTATRATDADAAADFVSGFKVYVREGSTQSGTYWTYQTNGTITLGTTSLAFGQDSVTSTQSANTVNAGPTSGGAALPTFRALVAADLPTFVGSGASHAKGAVPDPGSTAGTTKFLREDATFAYAAPSYINVQDQKTQNTNGGTFTSGAWQTRTLNTEVNDADNLCTLSSNQITLVAGTYRCCIKAPAAQVNWHQARLQNVTDSTTLLTGTSEEAGGAATGVTTSSIVTGQFTIAASKALEVQHRCTLTASNVGFGTPANLTTEVYTVIELWRVG